MPLPLQRETALDLDGSRPSHWRHRNEDLIAEVLGKRAEPPTYTLTSCRDVAVKTSAVGSRMDGRRIALLRLWQDPRRGAARSHLYPIYPKPGITSRTTTHSHKTCGRRDVVSGLEASFERPGRFV
jgi:hypothetical protein